MKEVIVTTSWDDGHVLDLRLAALLKKYGIRGTFYIAPKNREINIENRLTDTQIAELSKDFEIGAHTMTHPRLPRISDNEARLEIEDSKKYLEKVTGQAVNTFCYTRGEYLPKHVTMVKEIGFTYARTVRRHSFRTGPALEAHTTIHTYNHWSDAWRIARFANFNPITFFRYFRHWEVLARAMFDRAEKEGGTFHLWGHSWEIEKHNDWRKLESVLDYISHKNAAQYVANGELTSSQKRKVLIVTPYFLPHTGGVEFYTYNIIKHLKNDFTYDLCVVTTGSFGFRKVTKEKFEDITLYRLPYWFKISNTPISFLWPTMLRHIIREESIDIINVHTPVPGLPDMAAFVAGSLPVAVTYHSGAMRKNEFLPDILIWMYEHGPLTFLLKRAEVIICASDFVREDFLGKYKYKSTTITPGVDIKRFNPGPQEGKTPHRVLFVAGLNRSQQFKGIIDIISAIKILKETIHDLHLVIAGDGDMRLYYEEYISKVGLKEETTFTGKLMGEDLVKVYREAGVVVLPSRLPAESFGMVLLEGMACRKAVIGTNLGGIPHVIDDEKTGLLIPEKDPEALAVAIKRIFIDEKLAKRLAEAGYQKAQGFSWDDRAIAYNELFKRI